MKEIVFISGKGGTGKTTVTSSLFPLFEKAVTADCDVDAPNMEILLNPEILKTDNMYISRKAFIDRDKCTDCGECIPSCRFNALFNEEGSLVVNNYRCEGCKVCTLYCSQEAITLEKVFTGKVFTSRTQWGPFLHARLNPGEEVSGKLISEVRRRAKGKAFSQKSEYLLIDGPPGVACNVISSITGTSLAVLVTEPSVSAIHDLKRVHQMAKQLNVPTAVLINKSDLSVKCSEEIKRFCHRESIALVGEIPFSREAALCITNKKIPSLYLEEQKKLWNSILHRVQKIVDN